MAELQQLVAALRQETQEPREAAGGGQQAKGMQPAAAGGPTASEGLSLQGLAPVVQQLTKSWGSSSHSSRRRCNQQQARRQQPIAAARVGSKPGRYSCMLADEPKFGDFALYYKGCLHGGRGNCAMHAPAD